MLRALSSSELAVQFKIFKRILCTCIDLLLIEQCRLFCFMGLAPRFMCVMLYPITHTSSSLVQKHWTTLLYSFSQLVNSEGSELPILGILYCFGDLKNRERE